MRFREIRTRYLGRTAFLRSGRDFLETSRQIALQFLRAAPLILLCCLVWQHRALRCGPGLTQSIRLLEKARIAPDAPNLIENFAAGILYACIAYYGFLFLCWLGLDVKADTWAKGRWQLWGRGLLVSLTLLLFKFGWLWSDVSYGACTILAAGYIFLVIKPALALAWFRRHYKTTIGALALSIWIYNSLAWKVRELQDRSFKLQSCAKDAKGHAIEVSGHVTWTHAWPQLLVSLAGMALGLFFVSVYWTRIRAKGSRPKPSTKLA